MIDITLNWESKNNSFWDIKLILKCKLEDSLTLEKIENAYIAISSKNFNGNYWLTVNMNCIFT